MILDTTEKHYYDNDNFDIVGKEIFDKYYYLYEYSDEIKVIADSFQYPSILNYIRTGLLTEEEMLKALQHE